MKFLDKPYYEKDIVGPIERWDLRRDPRLRSRPDMPYFDPEWKARFDAVKHHMVSQEERAYREAAWYVRRHHPPGDGPVSPYKIPIEDEAAMAARIKELAVFFGADIVGIARLNQNWVYSRGNFSDPDKVIDLSAHTHVIIVGAGMDYQRHRSAPSPASCAAVGDGYSKGTYISTRLAAYIRGLGYLAEAHMNAQILPIPCAIDAGLGEQGRHGLLITPQFGPRLRLYGVTTDLPMQPDRPVDMGVQDFCRKCLKCAKHCPAGAISLDGPTAEPPTKSNLGGVRKWMINAEECYICRDLNPSHSCGICIRVCPWNKKPVWYHRASAWMAMRSSTARSILIWLDDFLSYGKKAPEDRVGISADKGLVYSQEEWNTIELGWTKDAGVTATIPISPLRSDEGGWRGEKG